MSLLDFLSSRPKTSSGKRARVRITRAIALKDWLGEYSHRAVGDEVEILASEAAVIRADGDCEIVAFIDEEGNVIEGEHRELKPAPRKHEPTPLPDTLKDLPDVFAKAHAYLAKRAALVLDIYAAREAALPPEFVAAQKYAASRGEESSKYFLTSLVRIGGDHLVDRVRDNEFVARSEEALNDFDARESWRLASEIRAAGIITIQKIDSSNTAAEELANVALEIFTLRLAVLELHPSRIYQLFRGSGLFVRYASFSPLGSCDAVFLGGVNPRITIDAPIEQIASLYRSAVSRLAEVKELLAVARAELSAARAVAALPLPAKKAA